VTGTLAGGEQQGTTMLRWLRLGGGFSGAAALIVAAIVAGCAGLPAGMQAPSITVADFGVGNAGLFEQQFDLKLRIQNPNPDEFRIDGIAFDLDINDQAFAKGVGNQAVTVPRYGSGYMQVEAISNLGGFVRQFGRFAATGRPAIKYRIKGTVSIANGTRVPFDERGEFDFSGLTGKP
jgi:LEA14-like dessication related protein